MRISRFLILVLAPAVATQVLAGPLAPSKPSDVVTLMPNASDGSNGSCNSPELIVIKPGASLCAVLDVAGTDTFVFPRLTGFLAKDK